VPACNYSIRRCLAQCQYGWSTRFWNENTKQCILILIHLLDMEINWLHPVKAGRVPNVLRSPIQTWEKPLTCWEVLESETRLIQGVVFHLTGAFMGPTMKHIHNTLKMLIGCILPKWAVAKYDLKHTVDIISKALIFPKFH
jgi:hypothetical protein